MLNLYNAPSTQIIYGKNSTVDWVAWHKPPDKKMVHILLVGKGGNGGTGAVGANSNAAGGGGGGSGSQTRLIMPLDLLPNILYFSLAGLVPSANTNSFVCIDPIMVAINTLMIASQGGNGGNAAAAVAGAGGTAGAIATAANMPLGWNFATALAGQAGIIGGVAVAGANLALPLTGLLVTGGTGGGGLPAAATAGTVGGSIAGAGVFPTNPAQAGAGVATTPPLNGGGGFNPIKNLVFNYGGTGSGSTHGSATGAGLVQAPGGNGLYGCGGGGSGGALTGSVAGSGGLGGISFAVITCW